MTATPKPVDNPHVCPLCGAKIRKNNQSWRGPIPLEMLRAMQQAKPDLTVKDDICKECGQKYFEQVKATARIPAWMTRPLG